MSRRTTFDDELLARLRELPLTTVMDRLGLHFKEDPDFKPEKDVRTKRYHVSVGSSVMELLVTGTKWFDSRAGQGGGGGIDLAMHLLRIDFVTAVKSLTSGTAQKS